MSRVRRAFVMASLEQYLSLLINFAMVAAISRILPPSEIGVAVIGLGLSIIVFSLREFATAEFIIQLHRVRSEDVRTAHTILIGLGLFLAFGLYVFSPVLARYYSEPGLQVFLTVMIVSALLEGTVMPAHALLRRDMAFGVLAWIRTASLATMSTTTIGLALLGYGFMSYAWGSLAAACLSAVLIWRARPDAYQLKPSLASWRKLYDFGRFRGATGFVDRAYDSLPSLVLGRFMPAAAVGIYNRTNAVCAIPDRILLSAVFAMAFPALAAEVREGRAVDEHYLRALGLITVLYWPALILLAILADPVVYVVLGPAWDEAVPLVVIISIAGLFFFPVILTHPMLMALGENREAFASTAISKAFAAIMLCSASMYGLMAMAFSQFIAIPIQMLVSFYYVKKHLDFAWRDLFKTLLRSAAVTAGASAGALAVVAAFQFRFDLSVMEAGLVGLSACFGWLASALMTGHPILDELLRLVPLIRRQAPAAETAVGAPSPSESV